MTEFEFYFRGPKRTIYWDEVTGQVSIKTEEMLLPGILTHPEKADNKEHAVGLAYELLTRVQWIADNLIHEE